jgi:serine/threonine protein kinase/tetratricopeptide (TPR) repeat protein
MSADEKSVFAHALEQADPQERARFLDRACAGDPALRRNVESLLAAYDAGQFLETPAAVFPAGPDAGTGTGTILGPYKLLQPIGEGGMGTVYLAQQTVPVRRQVALKVINPGMDSRLVVARFEYERQALALMDHPNIAKVHDGGTTVAGQPYFVMELVKGPSVTTYCDRRRLTPKERLRLFLPICEAIQHAHQKGIIHRDIKPSNVLVASYDDRPVPKVIDFGVAKAAGQPLTERTLVTGFGTLVGTLEYMSPEQAELNQFDIDTRSDIYSLGVLLYELLTGGTPLDKKQLKDVPLTEVLRRIRAEDPPSPSTRLSTAAELPAIAVNRGLEPRQLPGVLRGELDWIVMKCLEKDRGRRYESASALARDIEHYLADEPVSASPPSRSYRLKKLLRRHRGSVLAAAVVLLALVGGIIGTTVGLLQAEEARQAAQEAEAGERAQRQLAEGRRAEAVIARDKEARERAQAAVNEMRANEERDRAEKEMKVAQAVQAFLQYILRQANSGGQAGVLMRAGDTLAQLTENPTIRELLDRAANGVAPERIEQQFSGQPLVQAAILHTIGEAYRGVGAHAAAIAHLRRAHDLWQRHLGPDHKKTLVALGDLAMVYHESGKLKKAIGLLEPLHERRARLFGPDHPFTLHTRQRLAVVYGAVGKVHEAVRLLEEVRDKRLQMGDADDPDRSSVLIDLALAYQAAGKPRLAVRLLEEVRDQQAKLVSPDHPVLLNTISRLALAYQAAGKPRLAIDLLEQVCAKQIRQDGADHPSTLNTRHCLAEAYFDAGQSGKAIRLFEQVRDASIKKLGADHMSTLSRIISLAGAYREAGRLDEAIRLYEHVRDRQTEPNQPATLITLNQLAVTYNRTGKVEEATRLLEQVRDRAQEHLGPEHPLTLAALANLAQAYQRGGKAAQAIRLLEHVRDQHVARLGPDHATTLNAQHNLAAALGGVKQFDRSVPMLEEVLRKREEILGPLHPRTLWTMLHLAMNYRDAGRGSETVPLLEQALERARQLPPPLPERLLGIHQSLAQIHSRAGHFAKAEAVYRECLEQTRRLFGADHPRTLQALHHVAWVNWAAGRFDRSLPLFAELYPKYKVKLGPDHPDTLMALANLAINYRDAGRTAEAVPLLEEAVQRAGKLPKLTPALRAFFRQTMAETYDRAGRFTRSEPYYRAVLEHRRQKYGAAHPRTDAAQAELGANLLGQKKYDEAQRLLRECLAYRTATEPDAWATFNARSLLGAALLGQKEYDAAEPLLREGYEGLKRYQERIPAVARRLRLTEALQRLMLLYEAQGQTAEAATWHKELDAVKAAAPTGTPGAK